MRQISMLSQSQKQGLFCLLLIFVAVVVMYYLFGDKLLFLSQNAQSSQRVANLKGRVSENTQLYSMLTASNPDYEEANILSGLDGDYFTAYFTPLERIDPNERRNAPAVVATRPAVNRPSGTPTPTVSAYADSLSFIYSGSNDNYVIIDGKLIKEGENTLSGYTVSKIESNRVLLQGKRSAKWISLKF